MRHICGDLCKAIVQERAKGHPCPPVWNALTHEEQEAWLTAEHAWGVMNMLRRAIYAGKVLVGRDM